jgi:hypothetical protein
MPSQYTSPSSVVPTLVKMELVANVAMALGFVSYDVPGATPKKPFSGLMARMRPCVAETDEEEECSEV